MRQYFQHIYVRCIGGRVLYMGAYNLRKFVNPQARLNSGAVESLQSLMILTMSHWSSGLTCLLPATRVTGSNPQGGTYVKLGFSC
jgi:hypothetical protein